MDQMKAIEVMRKRLELCRATYRQAQADFFLDVASGKFNLRGGPGSGSGKSNPIPESFRKGVSQRGASSKEIDTLSKLTQQLNWLRRAQTEVDSLFEGRHATILRNELTKMADDIDVLVKKALQNKKFPTGSATTDVYKKEVAIASRLVAKLVGKSKITVSELMTEDSKDNQFFTTFIVAHNVKISKTTVLPTYVIAVSESSEEMNKRRRYLTQMPQISLTFDPKYMYKGIDDFKQVLQTIASRHFINDINSEGTKNINPDIIHKIAGVDHSVFTTSGALKVQLTRGADEGEVGARIYRALVEEINRSRPGYGGKITYLSSKEGGRTYLTFSAPVSKLPNASSELKRALHIGENKAKD